MTDVTGSWIGSYWQNGIATRFEATFVQGGNVISGRILDDGPNGEAEVHGDAIGRHVDFVKRYFSYPENIHYTGTLSDEGNFMSGTWNIGSRHSGPWEAYRGENPLMNELQKRLSRNVTLTGPRM